MPGPPGGLASALRTAAKSEGDADDDGLPDASDAFPNDPGEFLDSDGDGIGNFADADEDGDSVLDQNDAFPFDPARWAEVTFTESEPNDTVIDADVVPESWPITIQGTLDGPLDVDVIKRPPFPPIPPGQFVFWTIAYRATVSSAVDMSLIDASGGPIQSLLGTYKPKNGAEALAYSSALPGNIYYASDYG